MLEAQESIVWYQRNNGMIDMTFDKDEVNSLIFLLQIRGVCYLRGTAEVEPERTKQLILFTFFSD